MPNAPMLAPARDNGWRIGRGLASGGTRQYIIPGCSVVTTTTATVIANRDYYCPIIVRSPVVVDEIAAEVTTTGAGNFRIGLYAADSDWQPIGAPLADSGDISTASAAVKTYAPTAFVLGMGRYVSVFNSNDAAANWRVFVAPGEQNGIISTIGSSATVWRRLASRTYAAFPTPGQVWTSIAADTQGTQHFVVYGIKAP